MTLETKNERNAETTDAWEQLLARRLADDLDAFLETASDETFLFGDETNAPRRVKRIVNALRFKTLATLCASLALLVGVAATARFYVAAPTENVVEPPLRNDEASLLAWSVSTLSDAGWSRDIEKRWANVAVFGDAASSEAENAEIESPERLAVADDGKTEVEGNDAPEPEANEWLSVETLNDVAMLEPLKYEPFLQAVAASVR